MIGRTNANSSTIRVVSGSFTSSKTSTQKSFSVSGLTFEPKYIVVMRTSKSSVNETGAGVMFTNAFVDFTGGIGIGLSGLYESGNGGGNHTVYNSPVIVMSGSGGTYTFTLSNAGEYGRFSVYFNSNSYSWGTYSYHVYG